MGLHPWPKRQRSQQDETIPTHPRYCSSRFRQMLEVQMSNTPPKHMRRLTSTSLRDQVEINRSDHTQMGGNHSNHYSECQSVSGGFQHGTHIQSRQTGIPPTVSEPGKRGRVVNVKQLLPLTTPEREERRAVVPEHMEPVLGDKVRHTN